MSPWFWKSKPVPVWYHPSFRLPFTTLPAEMDARRADHVLTWLLDRRLVTDDSVHEAPEASWADLRRVHDDRWLSQLDDPDVVANVLGVPSGQVPVDSMVELWRRGVGAAVEATRYVLENGGRAATLMGGFHHAAPDRGSGFCAVNDVATAIGAARDQGFQGHIVVLDFDAHPPDGLVAFGLDNCSVRSVGVESEWQAESAIDLRVPVGTDDGPYLRAIRHALVGLEADLVFYIAGSDPLVGDALGALAVTESGLRTRDKMVFEAVDDTPVVVVPGGGYTKDAWRIYAHTIAEAAQSSTSVREGYDPVARRVGRVARTFPAFADEPLLTPADVAEMFGRPQEKRFLGHFTRHGVELALERYGLLGALHRLGFGDLDIQISTGDSPERVRVFANVGGSRERLVDLVVSRHQFHGFQLLRVEWLELRDPRQDSTLPGQKRGGLGVAHELGSILAVTARGIGLDGVSFVPSHFHVAWIARHLATFYDPILRGRFRALLTFLEGAPLTRASVLLAEGGLPTEDGEPLVWMPGEMVHATDKRLREALRSTRAEAKAVERGTLLRLLDRSVSFDG